MIEKQSRKEFYRELHRIADASRGKVRRAFLKVIKQLKDRVPKAQLRRAVETGNVQKVLQVIDVPKTMENQADEFMSNLRAVFEQAAFVSVEQLPKTVKEGIRFDLLNPRSVQFLQNYRMDLISPVSINRSGQNVGVTKQTIGGIRQIVTDAFERGGHPRDQARQIEKHIGVTARQGKTLANHWNMLFEEGVPMRKIEQRIDRLYARLLRQRANNIARTETIRAASAGQQAVWDQAADQGLLDRGTTRRGWVVTPDDRLCPICKAIPKMNPKGVPLGKPFNTTVGPVQHPPAHPQCRCATAIIKF